MQPHPVTGDAGHARIGRPSSPSSLPVTRGDRPVFSHAAVGARHVGEARLLLLGVRADALARRPYTRPYATAPGHR